MYMVREVNGGRSELSPGWGSSITDYSPVYGGKLRLAVERLVLLGCSIMTCLWCAGRDYGASVLSECDENLESVNSIR